MAGKHTVVSLFSGGGGLDIGLEQSGRTRLLACCEKEAAFCATLRANHEAGRLGGGPLAVVEADISSLSPEALMGAAGVGPGELAVLAGGPPCQSFSTAGKRQAAADPRGLLIWHFLRMVAALRPAAFLMENVRGLAAAALPGQGKGSVLARWADDLPEGYRVDAFTVNAVNHGAPQARERLLLFGNRLGRAASFPSPTHGKPPLVPFRTLGEALEGLDREGDGVLDFSPRKKGFLAMVPPGGNWRSLPDAVAREAMGRAYFRNGGRSAFWRRLSHDLPAPTIMAMPNHISTALCHPTETRALSLKECARLQEFPDGWAFAGTLAQRYAQVGNAVPVRLARLAAGVLAEILDGTAPPAGGLPRFRLGYVQSHVRTRRWFKDGQAVVRETPA